MSDESIKITKDTKISEIVKNFPRVMEIFFKYGMFCVGCPIASGETLEQACVAHGLDPNEILREIDNFLSQQEGKIED